MSEYDNEYENEETEREVDPGTVAFLDQQEAEFAQDREQFQAIYGFDHDCHCSQDYTDGKLAEVTQCFLTLTSQALNRAAEATYENRVLSGLVEELFKVNNDLMYLMKENGLGSELEKYVKETYELDDQQVSDLQLALDVEDAEVSEVAGEDAEDESEDES